MESFIPTLAVVESVAWVVAAVVGLVIALVLLWILLLVFSLISLWFKAILSSATVSMFDLIGMRFRKVNPHVIVDSRIQAVKAGLEVSSAQLESHYLAGGDVIRVVRAFIAADRANLDLDWDTACTIDLAGRDVLEAVQTSVNPKVINCPSETGSTDRLDAVAKDGVRLLCMARVTVRTNLRSLIGGATEETIIARVGQAIVSAIGSSESYEKVLENPDLIARRALESGLDSGTAFTILSVDIADVSVAGVSAAANVGAILQAEQAEADKQRFQAEAEKKRALAIAQEQEHKAEIQKNQALVVLAKAEVPKAIAEAFRSGNLGIMDYYRFENIQADTSMRGSIAGDEEDGDKPAS